MDKKKKSHFNIILILIVIFLFLITKKIHENNTLLEHIKIVKYIPGTNFFSNRKYINSKNDEILKDKYLIQLPRHFKNNLILIPSSDVLIYRVLCDKNENSTYNDWQKINFKLNISGISCTHSKVVMKEFKSGQVRLKPGGPISSDPILIKGLKELKDLTVKINLFN